ncbi:hypothetical protein G7Y89_g1664 [Cudoniella acicularis]|uniref:Carboxymuconolactone decarboxylase-like domain-containing protein n=1 Tax=Cudoniella acicularis TaxID=354080 RepID=A0A8H4RUV3_9HELO|nr:hypothetical protein G7Y89_g1664 [Cudoniella acicularis]
MQIFLIRFLIIKMAPGKDLNPEFAAQIEQDSIKFIQELASKPENQKPSSSWYIIAACGFAASGQGPLVAEVYKAAIAQHSSDDEARRLILRRIKVESLITSSFIFGVPRLLNAFFPLIHALPSPHLNDNTTLRSYSQTPSFSSVSQRGEVYMRVVFGSGDLDTFLQTMEEYWPDLKNLIVNDVYGMYQAEVSILGKIETSMINIASLVPMDCPAEVGWHMRGLVNNGGSVGEVETAFGIARGVVDVCRVGLKKKLPKIEDVVGKERLISREG